MVDGIRPRRTLEAAKTAVLDAMAMSQAATRPRPPPIAAPLTIAMVVLGDSAMVRYISASWRAFSRLAAMGAAPWRFMDSISAPAEKLLPLPDKTMTRTDALSARVRNASVISS